MRCFFSNTATTHLSPLSLHDPLPILSESLTRYSMQAGGRFARAHWPARYSGSETTAFGRGEATSGRPIATARTADRKSTRLNSSHGYISYAVFCLKKKKQTSYHKTGP